MKIIEDTFSVTHDMANALIINKNDYGFCLDYKKEPPWKNRVLVDVTIDKQRTYSNFYSHSVPIGFINKIKFMFYIWKYIK